jgi:hypothetical protein
VAQSRFSERPVPALRNPDVEQLEPRQELHEQRVLEPMAKWEFP